MCKIISIVNQKGGVGKTTTSINVATALASLKKNILIIDLDPQGNASTGLGISNKNRGKNVYKLLVSDLNNEVDSYILPTQIPHLYIIPSVVDLSAAEIELSVLKNREAIIKNKCKLIADKFDYIIIDCPPSLGLLTINALVASSDIIVPLQCEFFALEGLAHLLQTVSMIQNNINKNLQILGVLLTMYDRRNRITEAVESDVRSCLGDLVFKTVIPRNSKISEAPSHGLPAIIYDHKSSGAMAYVYFVKEMLERFSKVKNKEEEYV